MADTENEKELEKNEIDSGTEAASEAQTTLRDLVLSAGAALSDLDVGPGQDAPLKEPDSEAATAESAESIEAAETGQKSNRKKRGKKELPTHSEAVTESVNRALESISWTEETSDLDFAGTQEETFESEEAKVIRLAEVAKRVAETAAKKNAQSIADVHTDPNFEVSEEEAAEIEAAEATEVAEASEAENIETEDVEAELEAKAADETAFADEVSDAEEVTEEPAASPTEQMELRDLNEQEEGGEEEAETEAEEEDSDAEPQEFIDHAQMLSIIESLLFATDRPVSLGSIKQIFKGTNIRTKDIKQALEELASEYAAPSRGVTLEEVNGGYQLRTKSDNAEYLRRLVKTRPFRLSGPALEVLAIVAYKQPITKHQIDEIRGVESGHLLRALMERGLVAFGEKSDLPGKPMTYQTTRKFLETFGLRNIRELPTLREIDELLPEGIGEEEEKETLSDITEKMSNELAATYSEGEEELEKITEQLKAVDTTTEFFEQEKQRERERRDRERAEDIRERLILGEEVDEKDRRWLERYEAKLQAAEVAQNAEAQSAESVESVEGAETAEGAELADGEDKMAAAADESVDLSEAGNDSSTGEDEEFLDETEFDDSTDSADDLTAYQDWDDDSEEEA